MAVPIIETIAVEVVARLAAITIANGYEFTAASVLRPRRIDRDFTPSNLAIVVQQVGEVENEPMSCPGNPPAIAYDATFKIYGFIRESDNATDSPAIAENQMMAAIKKAITAETNWQSFDGNAIDATWGQAEFFEDGQSQPFTTVESNGVAVPLIISYRVEEGNPYNLRN